MPRSGSGNQRDMPNSSSNNNTGLNNNNSGNLDPLIRQICFIPGYIANNVRIG